MKELPKIARERLGRVQMQGPAAAAGVVSPHPDANLLSAFMEQALARDERERVLEHLAVCDACRNELALARRASGASEDATASMEPSGRWRRPTVRWAALAGACMVALAAAVFELNIRNRQLSTSPSAAVQRAIRETAPKLGFENEVASTAGAAVPESRAPRRLERASKTKAGAKPLSREAVTSLAPAPPSKPVLSSAVAESLAQQASTSEAKMAEARPAPAQRPAAIAGETSARALLVPEPSAPAAPEPPKARVQTMTLAAPAPGLAQGLALAPATPHAPTAASSAQWTIAPSAEASSGEASRGQVERSLDGGRTWQRVAVAADVDFRAIFASGNDVWAGGSTRALYHSADGGDHWERVTLQDNGATPVDSIVNINFTDAEQGTVITSANQIWSTTDGGRHWQKNR